MTKREAFIRTMKCEKIGGRVPHMELEYYLTMEKFRKVHPQHRSLRQWNQMSYAEKKVHIEDEADTFIQIARTYDHYAVHVGANPFSFENLQWLLETIREKVGDEFALIVYSDPTWPMPDGEHMIDFSVQMYEDPDVLNDVSRRNVEFELKKARYLHDHGHLSDAFLMASDYCFNTNPFFSPDQFDEFIVPYLKETIDEFHKMGYLAIKHTDGNIMPILEQMASCGPDAIHSLDPQGGVDLREVRRIVGPDIALIGNVNCGLLQTGTEEECDADVLRALNQGMADGRGYIFSTSNCVYTGLPLERYERMWKLWREHGVYPQD